jgi:hypothetical protein
MRQNMEDTGTVTIGTSTSYSEAISTSSVTSPYVPQPASGELVDKLFVGKKHPDGTYSTYITFEPDGGVTIGKFPDATVASEILSGIEAYVREQLAPACDDSKVVGLLSAMDKKLDVYERSASEQGTLSFWISAAVSFALLTSWILRALTSNKN